MESMINQVSWQHVGVTATAYFASLAIYRLYFHPLAKFPGPKLAAITRYYEAYFDIIRNGQYTFKIAELHKQYGPIIRISPYELHINDATFFEQLYRQDGRWNKYAFTYDAFATDGATICTADHALHRARRHPLGPFFSKAKVSTHQALIRHNIQKLCHRLLQHSVSSSVSSSGSDAASIVNFGAAISALTRDVANEFILGKHNNQLDHADFEEAMTNVFQESNFMWRVTKHVRWFAPTLLSIPVAWLMRVADEGTRALLGYIVQNEKYTKELIAAHACSASKEGGGEGEGEEGPRTIVHEILDSNLPASDKTFERIFGDVVTISAAGFETSASVLRLVFYHIYHEPSILKQLRMELANASSDTFDIDTVELRTLEHLPYLTAVLMEGLRLSPGIATRMARIAPDRELVYDEKWHIPAGTPVGMTALLMHTDPSIYPDPLTFKPERWMDVGARKGLEKTFAPFSRGTRMCIGMHLAWAEMYLVLAALVQRFDFQFVDVTASDFECESDQFVISTKARGVLKAIITPYDA